MESRLLKKITDTVQTERRDVAIIAAPGMGLSALLGSLPRQYKVGWLSTTLLQSFWEQEYEGRESSRRFVIHAGALRALINARLLPSMDDSEIYESNLAKVLRETSYEFNEEQPALIVIDNFDRLPNDLAVIACNEMKAIDDLRQQDRGMPLRSVHFVIGGAIDFLKIYGAGKSTGVSPATNFHKYRPYQMLLSQQETESFLESEFPRISHYPSLRSFVFDITAGHIYYAIELTKWILEEVDEKGPCSDTAVLLSRLKDLIFEQDKAQMFRYCYSAWNAARADDTLVTLLITAVSAGCIPESEEARQLSLMGLLIERPEEHLYYPMNVLVNLFLRQRLAEIGRLLPIHSCALDVDLVLNRRAYAILLEIENRLRAFIGDQLYAKHRQQWMTDGLQGIDCSGESLLKKIEDRMSSEQNSPYTEFGAQDSVLAYLDFPDLGEIVKQRQDLFAKNYSQFEEMFPGFLEELNYYRRRIAHNRPVTLNQITALENRWRIVKRMIARNRF